MSNLLLDSHIFLELTAGNPLSKKIEDAFKKSDNKIYLSIASIWEIAIKINLKDPFDRMLIAQVHIENFILVTNDKEICKYPGIKIWN